MAAAYRAVYAELATSRPARPEVRT
jgi:hypothetical protein